MKQSVAMIFHRFHVHISFVLFIYECAHTLLFYLRWRISCGWKNSKSENLKRKNADQRKHLENQKAEVCILNPIDYYLAVLV